MRIANPSFAIALIALFSCSPKADYSAVREASAEEVQRVEPLSWWTGMKTDLQLMVQGPEISAYDVAVEGKGLKVKAVHKAGGIIVIDAAQAMAHSSEVLRGEEPDAICFSAHKMYAPSLGVIVWRDDLDEKMDVRIIGGGMVDDVKKDSYLLSAEGT